MRDEWLETPVKFPCPCCGYLVFNHEPGFHKRCPICRWEDDLAQLRFPRMGGGANTVSLEDAQRNYARFGTAERKRIYEGRPPNEHDRRDPGWRPLDESRDNIEEPRRGIDYANSYPTQDPTVLYYWRSTYWRRFSS